MQEDLTRDEIDTTIHNDASENAVQDQNPVDNASLHSSPDDNGTGDQESPKTGIDPGEGSDQVSGIAAAASAPEAGASSSTPKVQRDSQSTKFEVRRDSQSTDPVKEQNSIDFLMDVPLDVSVELGQAKITIKDMLQLGSGSVVELDRLIGEPVDLLVNGRLIARGEVVVFDESFGIRITDIVNPEDRIRSLR